MSSEQQQVDVEALWAEFFPRLRAVVARRVRAINRSVASESEVALSAFNSFIELANTGKAFLDREEMWKVIRTIAIRKANDARKKLRAQKRGGNVAIVGQATQTQSEGPQGVDAAIAASDTPSVAVEVSDFFNHMLDQLPDERQRDMVLLKLQGASVAMIAECLNTTTRTVQRTLRKIEEQWSSALQD